MTVLAFERLNRMNTSNCEIQRYIIPKSQFARYTLKKYEKQSQRYKIKL